MNATAEATYIGNFEMRDPDGSVRPVTNIEMETLARKKRAKQPFLYIAGPYTKPDPVENTHRMIRIADELLSLDVVPVVPHLTMFWHLLRPHPYEHWLAYDLQLMSRCDIVLRVPGESSGADREVIDAERLGIPVIHPATTDECVSAVREWLETVPAFLQFQRSA